MFDLLVMYMSVTDTVGGPLKNMVATMNESDWLETSLPKWDYTSSMLRFWIIAGYSAINLLPMKRISSSPGTMRGSPVRPGSPGLSQTSSDVQRLNESRTLQITKLLAKGEEVIRHF